jgi:hypothetical protein
LPHYRIYLFDDDRRIFIGSDAICPDDAAAPAGGAATLAANQHVPARPRFGAAPDASAANPSRHA